MSIYRVVTAGHGLVPGDLLFGGGDFQAPESLVQIRFQAYDELGARKGFVFLPLSWLRDNVVLSTKESGDPAREEAFQVQLRGERAEPSFRPLSPLFSSSSSSSPHGPTVTTVEPPLSADDRACLELGALYASDKEAFRRYVNDWLRTAYPPTGVPGRKAVILLSDRMSGDSRLGGLFASYQKWPVLYIVTRERVGKFDMGAKYLTDLGVRLLRFCADDAHEAYKAFSVKLEIALRKGAKLTEDVGELLNQPQIPQRPDYPHGSAFRAHARAMVHEPDIPARLRPMLAETRPVLVIWTKARAVPTLFKGRPEHLLGNTGTLQICQLGHEMGFAVALAGDLTPNHKILSLMDYDLRYAGGGLTGLSMREQYGVLQYINVYVPLIHVAMRSGNIEPLPLFGMRTVYMEEEGNTQGERMQKWQQATKGFYDRHVFTVPPTIKGRLREMVTYFFDWPFRQSIKGKPADVEMMRMINILIRQYLGLARSPFADLDTALKDKEVARQLFAYFESLSGPQGDDNFRRLKTWLTPEDFPKGFSAQDMAALRNKLQELRIQGALLKGIGIINALKAATGL